MPYNAEQNQLETQNKDLNAQQASTPEKQLAGSGDVGIGAAPANTGRIAMSSSGTQPGGQVGSGRFTNLNKYLNANQGAGDNLGNRITSKIDNNVVKADNEANDNASKIRDAIGKQSDNLNQGTKFQTQISEDPTQITAQQDKKNLFSNLLNQRNDLSNIQNQTNNVRQNVQSNLINTNRDVEKLGSEEGRSQLLKQTINQPGYSNGQNRLDQLFLQAENPNKLVQQQRGLGQRINTIGNNVDNIYGQFDNTINQEAIRASQVAGNLKNTLGTETTGFVNAQTKEAEGLNTENSRVTTALDRYFTNGYASLDAAQKATVDQFLTGTNLQNGMRTYNAFTDGKHNNYITQGRTNLAAADVIDNNELSRYQALAQLAEQNPDAYLFNSVGNAGPSSALETKKMSQGITTARDALVRRLDPNAVEHNRFDTSTGTLTHEIDGYARANLQTLLDKYEREGADASAISTDYNVRTHGIPGSTDTTNGTNYSGPPQSVDYNWSSPTDINANRSIFPDINNTTNLSRQVLFQQFLDQINAGGANTALGGGEVNSIVNKMPTGK